MVQWFGLWAFIAEGTDLVPSWGTKIPQATWCGQKKKKKGKRAGLNAFKLTHIEKVHLPGLGVSLS